MRVVHTISHATNTNRGKGTERVQRLQNCDKDYAFYLHLDEIERENLSMKFWSVLRKHSKILAKQKQVWQNIFLVY